MKKLKVLLLLGSCILLGAFPAQAEKQSTGFRTPFSNQLEKQIQQAGQVQQNPGMGRLMFTRFYFPRNYVAKEPSFRERFQGCDDETLINAYAVYLYNMYVGAAAYQEDVPASLTLDYVGVLDGFSKCANGFEVGESVSFYDKHRTQIQTIMKKFFQERKLPTYALNNPENERREKAFLNVLTQAFRVGRKDPAYRAFGKTRLQGVTNEEEVDLLKRILQRALAKGSQQVIKFEQREPFGPELDSPYMCKRANVRTIYRGVNEECGSCSYFFGREMCEEIAAKHRDWGFVRVYRITAFPKERGLRTAAGNDQFVLANGQKSPSWDYHTATLVIMHLDRQYTPYIIDKFLAGNTPMAPNEWISKFALTETVFLIKPFERKEDIEDRFERK